MPQISPLRPGDPSRLGPFALSGRIGEGGQGVVYLGRDAAGEQAAIKLLHVKFGGDAIARSRFARELRAAQRVASFCTARVLAADLEGDTPYIASEYIDGRSLRDTVEESGPLTAPALERLAVGTATALIAIHQAGIVHRDLKPDNVLMAVDGPRVVDFGIARLLDSTATITSRAVGTPAYMAPEQISGEPVGPPADVFAWASTIAYAATGQAVFGGGSIAVVLNKILNHEIDVDMMAEPLRGVVRDCLSKRPEARPTADQILLRLLGRPGPGGDSSALLSEGAVHAAGDTVTPPSREDETQAAPKGGRSPLKGRWIALLTAVTAMVLTGGAAAVMNMSAGAGTQDPVMLNGATASAAPASPGAAFRSVAEKAERTHRLTIGVKGDLPGVALMSGKDVSGFDIDVAASIASRLGVPRTGITFRRIGAGERASSLSKGTVDMIVATYPYDDNRQDPVTFAGPYYLGHTDVLTIKDAPIHVARDLAGRRICAPLGNPSVPRVQDKASVTVVPAPDYAECMNLLTTGKVDAVPGDDLILAGFADRVPGLRLSVVGLRLTDQRYAVGLPAGDVTTCAAVDRAISQMYRDGTVNALLKQHFGNVRFTPERAAPAPIICR